MMALMAETEQQLDVLLAEDVARIWTEEKRKKDPDATPVPVSTVWSYRKKSRAMVGSEPGRYADNPMPAPLKLGGQILAWAPGQEQALRDWWNNRPGAGTRTDLTLHVGARFEHARRTVVGTDGAAGPDICRVTANLKAAALVYYETSTGEILNVPLDSLDTVVGRWL